MHAASVLLLLSALLGGLATAAWAGLRHTGFNFQRITVLGDTNHNSSATLRANVLPKLQGNFLTLDLQQAQRSFEQVPWVRSATVQRDFPNRLKVRLQEHVPAAMFGVDSESTIVNNFGEVFVANAGDIVQELPRLVGTEAQAPQLLRMLRAIEPLLQPHDLAVERLELSSRGSWRMVLDTEASIELGRGDEAEVLHRLSGFLASLTTTSSQLGRKADDLVSADLRYPNGYALRLRGIATTASSPTPNR
jgi:cell division protein FtsQ